MERRKRERGNEEETILTGLGKIKQYSKFWDTLGMSLRGFPLVCYWLSP